MLRGSLYFSEISVVVDRGKLRVASLAVIEPPQADISHIRRSLSPQKESLQASNFCVFGLCLSEAIGPRPIAAGYFLF